MADLALAEQARAFMSSATPLDMPLIKCPFVTDLPPENSGWELTIEATEDSNVSDEAILVVATMEPVTFCPLLPSLTVVFYHSPMANRYSALRQSDRP